MFFIVTKGFSRLAAFLHNGEPYAKQRIADAGSQSTQSER